jgi:hypothetical protein
VHVTLTCPQLSLPVKRNAFTPYESPLKMFKAYRYHPEYGSTVSTGFGSMTYCNNINPDISICQWEADGGVCNDPQCSGQHFKDMRLAGAYEIEKIEESRSPLFSSANLAS